MNVTREYLLVEISSIRETLLKWQESVDQPTNPETGKPLIEEADMPDGLRVMEILSEADLAALRAELTGIAHRLEALATS